MDQIERSHSVAILREIMNTADVTAASLYAEHHFSINTDKLRKQNGTTCDPNESHITSCSF
jgi:hypothetical protein